MFSQGQVIFAAIFVVFFIISLIYSYQKENILHKQFYKGNYKILLGFLVFIGLLFVIKIYFKH